MSIHPFGVKNTYINFLTWLAEYQAHWCEQWECFIALDRFLAASAIKLVECGVLWSEVGVSMIDKGVNPVVIMENMCA